MRLKTVLSLARLSSLRPRPDANDTRSRARCQPAIAHRYSCRDRRGFGRDQDRTDHHAPADHTYRVLLLGDRVSVTCENAIVQPGCNV